MALSELNLLFYGIGACLLLGMVWLFVRVSKSAAQVALLQQALQQAQSQSQAWRKRSDGRWQASRQLFEAGVSAPQSDKAEQQIRRMVHDIHQPLGAVLLYAEHLQNVPEMPGPEKAEICHQITLGIDRAQQCLSDFRLSFANELRGHAPLALDALLHEVADVLASPWREAGVTLALDVQPGLQVMGDASLLKMVLLDGLAHALDTLPVHVGELRLRVEASRTGAMLCLRIHDAGPDVALQGAARGAAQWHNPVARFEVKLPWTTEEEKK